MGKLTSFVFIFIGIALLFNIFGLVDSTEMPSLLGFALHPENITTSSIWNLASLAFAGALGLTTIIVGFVTKNIQIAVKGPITILLISTLLDFIQVFNKINAQNGVIAIIIFGPLMLMVVLTLVDWLFGTD